MTTYIKNYIGKGKAVQINGQNTDLVQVTIKMEDAEAFIYEKEGHKYLTFQIAKLKEEDNFQRGKPIRKYQMEPFRKEVVRVDK